MSALQKFITDKTPDGWTARPFWSLFQRVKRTGFSDEELLSVYRDYGVIPKSSRDDNHNKESEDLSNYQLVDKGWLVTNKMKAWQGSIAISRYRGIVSPAYYAYKPLSQEHDQFLHYLLRSDNYIALYGRISKGVRVNQWDLEHEALRNIPVLLPPYETQKEIADFLDQETARIEKLIEKKQLLLSLAHARIVSRIESVLTKGLDNYSELKPSGILWLGDIPSKWDLMPLRHLVKISTGSRDTQDRIDDAKYPFFVRSETIERIDSYALDTEAVLTSGDGAGVGKIFHHYKGKFDLHQRVYAFTNFRHVTARYFYYFLSAFFNHQMTQHSAKSTVDSVRMPFLKGMVFTVPSITEQEKITSILDKECLVQKQLNEKLELSIEKLKELRSSLVTSAVTGQLDIHTWRKRSMTDRRMDKIEEDMNEGARAAC
jgi:type I restriction enzyme S subunit